MNEKPETKMLPKMEKKVCRLTHKQHIQSDDFKNKFGSVRFDIRALNRRSRSILVDEVTEYGSCTIFPLSLSTLFVQLLISKRYGNFFHSWFLLSCFCNAAFQRLRPLVVHFDFICVVLCIAIHIIRFMTFVCVHWFACMHAQANTYFYSISHGHLMVSMNDHEQFSHFSVWHSYNRIFGLVTFYFNIFFSSLCMDYHRC